MNTLVIFVNQKLKPKALSTINNQMQTYKAYLMYSNNQGVYEIVAFYYRIYELLSRNDFYKKK